MHKSKDISHLFNGHHDGEPSWALDALQSVQLTDVDFKHVAI